MRELSSRGKSPMFSRIAKQTQFFDHLDKECLVGTVFDEVFKVLRKKQLRHEYVYKSAIAHRILLGKHSLNTAAILNEFRACDSKADSVILNGTSTAYEIKSERDTLSRLKGQLDSYRKVFAQSYVITGIDHLKSIEDMSSEDVGILLLSDRYQISTVREANPSPENTDPAAIFDSIQMDEAKEVLRDNGVCIPQLPNTKVYAALKAEFIKLDPIIAHDGMVRVLKQTRSLSRLESFIGSLPMSLQSISMSTTINQRGRERLLGALQTPLYQALNWN